METVNLNGKKYGFMQPERLLMQQMSKAATITIGKDVWEIICKASEATEEQAEKILHKHDDESYWYYVDPLESLHSLIRSLGLEPETTIILQKK